MDAILPAAGLASRMRGIPKFLLPADVSYRTLIERHIEALIDLVDTIWVPTRPEQVLLLNSLGIAQEKVVVVPMVTTTMNHTIRRIMEISAASSFMLIMPDTRFIGEQPQRALHTIPEGQLAHLAGWAIRAEQRGQLGQIRRTVAGEVSDVRDKDPHCTYPHVWGALAFHRELMRYIDPADPHVGYAIRAAVNDGQVIGATIMDGMYFDCGTPSEYLNMLRATQDDGIG